MPPAAARAAAAAAAAAFAACVALLVAALVALCAEPLLAAGLLAGPALLLPFSAGVAARDVSGGARSSTGALAECVAGPADCCRSLGMLTLTGCSGRPVDCNRASTCSSQRSSAKEKERQGQWYV